MDRSFYKRWHAHPVREALRQAALGNEYVIAGIDDVDDVQRRQLYVAGEYLREKAAADGLRTLGLRAAEADRLSALVLGGDGFKLSDEQDDPPIGELADRSSGGRAAGELLRLHALRLYALMPTHQSWSCTQSPL